MATADSQTWRRWTSYWLNYVPSDSLILTLWSFKKIIKTCLWRSLMSSFSGSWPGPVFGYNVLDHLLPLLRLDPNDWVFPLSWSRTYAGFLQVLMAPAHTLEDSNVITWVSSFYCTWTSSKFHQIWSVAWCTRVSIFVKIRISELNFFILNQYLF